MQTQNITYDSICIKYPEEMNHRDTVYKRSLEIVKGRNGEQLLICIVSFGSDEYVLGLDSVDGCTIL